MDKQKMTRKQSQRNNAKKILATFWRNKKRISLVVAVLLVSFGVLAWERFDESDFQKHYLKNYTDVKISFRNAISDENAKIIQDIILSLDSAYSQISNESKTICEAHSQVKWQNFFVGFRKKIEACENQKSKLTDLLKSLNDLILYLKFESSLSDVISSANTRTSGSIASGKYEEIEPYWRQASTDIAKLVGFDELELVAVQNTNKMADVWKNLNNANVAKDQTSFNEARSGMAVVYAGYSEISNVANAKTDELIATIQTKYDSLK